MEANTHYDNQVHEKHEAFQQGEEWFIRSVGEATKKGKIPTLQELASVKNIDSAVEFCNQFGFLNKGNGPVRWKEMQREVRSARIAYALNELIAKKDNGAINSFIRIHAKRARSISKQDRALSEKEQLEQLIIYFGAFGGRPGNDTAKVLFNECFRVELKIGGEFHTYKPSSTLIGQMTGAYRRLSGNSSDLVNLEDSMGFKHIVAKFILMDIVKRKIGRPVISLRDALGYDDPLQAKPTIDFDNLLQVIYWYFYQKIDTTQATRFCQAPGCFKPIPNNAHGRIVYCDEHRKTSTARSRISRQNQRTKEAPANERID